MDTQPNFTEPKMGQESKPVWQPTKAQKLIAMTGGIIILVLVAGYLYASYLARKNYDLVALEAQKAQTANRQLVYRDQTFGFSIDLPESWRGYTVNHIKDDIYDVTGKVKTNNGVVDSFEIIELHHPAEDAQNPREDMPVYIFRPEQWEHIQNGEWSVGAAPIPPSVLGRNSRWIITLPARYNYDFKTGWEEVDELVHRLKVFEPPTNNQGTSNNNQIDTSTWKTYRNDEYGFEFKYPVLGLEQRIVQDKNISNEVMALYDLDYRAEGKDHFETAFSFGVLSNSNKYGLEQYYRSDECLDLLLGEEIRIHTRDNISWSRYFENGTLPLPDEYFNRECGPIYSVADFLKPAKENIIRVYFNGQSHELDLYGYETNEKIDMLTDRILSTFRFTK